VLILPYCVLLTNSADKLPSKGVRDTRVHAQDAGRLTVIYSEMEQNEIASDTFHQSALEFHHVVQAAFAGVAVIPFRFPTWLSKQEMAEHLEKESAGYQLFLTEHAEHVQMEFRVAAHPEQGPASSGTEHLRMRADQLREVHKTAEELRNLLAADVVDWRERNIAEGKRLFALVERSRVARFRERLSERGIRVTGPWPATEFLVAGG